MGFIVSIGKSCLALLSDAPLPILSLYNYLESALMKAQVMGLAPYAEERMSCVCKQGDRYFIKGNLYDGSLNVEDGKLKGLGYINKSWSDTDSSPELRQYFEDLAYYIQKDLEDVVALFVSELKQVTGEKNLVFAGGVALNSTLNGMLSASSDFDNVFVPPCPGDEGIAIGCAAFGCSHLSEGEQNVGHIERSAWSFRPYLGKTYDNYDFEQAIRCFDNWVISSEADTSLETARAIAESRIVAWFQGSSEFGPRALGNRSILADPRTSAARDFINRVVKRRESFRPFAPSVLAEDIREWFEDCGPYTSPYMSMTKTCTKPDRVRGVVHIDGTSRLQTVLREQNPKYHAMISAFKDLTGVPMVLNTSFNVAGEPIVNSPHDALRTFLASKGIDLLVFPGIIIEKKNCSLLRKEDTVSSACSTFRSHQVQDCYGASLRTTVFYISTETSGEDDEVPSFGMEDSVELIDSLQLEILEKIHMKGSCQVFELFEDTGATEYNDDDWEQSGAEADVPTMMDILDRVRDLFQKCLIFKA